MQTLEEKLLSLLKKSLFWRQFWGEQTEVMDTHEGAKSNIW